MDIFEMLKEAGVEISADKKDAFNKEFRKTYKSEGEISKATEKLEADRDNWKAKAEAAEETLKKFDGVDLETINAELNTWKTKAEMLEKDYAEKLAQRDFDDALKEEISAYKFTSEAAKKSIMAEIRASDLKLRDGKIIGLSDLIEQIKGKDSAAFVDEKQEQLEGQRAKVFTMPMGNKQPLTSAEKFKTMSLDERIKLKASNPAEYERLKKGE